MPAGSVHAGHVRRQCRTKPPLIFNRLVRCLEAFDVSCLFRETIHAWLLVPAKITKAAFGELKRQGLDLLSTEAGSHLLGHLLLKQGNFSEDQRQRIKVLADGSIDFPKVERAIRKLFGETVDEPGVRSKSFWQAGVENGY